MLRGAGAPLHQLALAPDDWLVHAAVVDRAHRMWLEEQQQLVRAVGGDMTILDVGDALDDDTEDDGG